MKMRLMKMQPTEISHETQASGQRTGFITRLRFVHFILPINLLVGHRSGIGAFYHRLG